MTTLLPWSWADLKSSCYPRRDVKGAAGFVSSASDPNASSNTHVQIAYLEPGSMHLTVWLWQQGFEVHLDQGGYRVLQHRSQLVCGIHDATLEVQGQHS